MTLDDFLTLPFHERIKWLHSAEGPHGKLSHDRFAQKLGGTSRQVIISWEKEGGAEPDAPLREALVRFSGFPAEVFSRREAEALVYESFGSRLQRLEDEADRQRSTLERILVALAQTGIALPELEVVPQSESTAAPSNRRKKK